MCYQWSTESIYIYIETKSLEFFFIPRDLNHANNSYDFFFEFYNVQGKSHIFIQLLRAHQNVYLLKYQSMYLIAKLRFSFVIFNRGCD